MPKMIIGKRTTGNKSHTIVYAGKESLLALLDEADNAFFNVLEIAAQNGWVDADRVLNIELSLNHLVIKYDVPQT